MTVTNMDNGNVFWTPRPATPPVQPSRNKEESFKGTVESTKRMYTMLTDGKITEEDYQSCLEKNSEHIGISKESLDEMIKTSESETDSSTNPESL